MELAALRPDLRPVNQLAGRPSTPRCGANGCDRAGYAPVFKKDTDTGKISNTRAIGRLR